MKNLTLQASVDNLEKFQDFISTCARKNSVPQSRIMKVQLASEEALMNIFNYAYPHDPAGEVSVSCWMDGGHDFLITFEDKGRAFDVLTVADPDIDKSLDERSVGGLGVFFIKQMTDDVWYTRKDGRNLLTFRIAIS